MYRKFFAWVQKYERHLSVFAMIAGFVCDNIFFERVDLWQTQVWLVTYFAACFISIPLLHYIETRIQRGRARPRWRFILPFITQFALGGFWSAFVIFYGRSAVVSASWPFLLLLFLVLLGSEYFHRYHERLVFTSVLFFFATYSMAIFVVPIYTGTMGTLTFLISGVVAILVFGLFTVLLRSLGRDRFLEDVNKIRVGAFGVLLVLNISYFTDILPPIPLTAKAAGIYHAVWRVPGAYLAKGEIEPWQVRYLGFKPTMHISAGETLYAYSAVFAPTILTTTIVHRWQWHNDLTGKWITESVIRYPISGGRDGGYRGYSAFPIRMAGEWRVDIETANGLVIARLPFAAKIANPSKEETITLR